MDILVGVIAGLGSIVVMGRTWLGTEVVQDLDGVQESTEKDTTDEETECPNAHAGKPCSSSPFSSSFPSNQETPSSDEPIRGVGTWIKCVCGLEKIVYRHVRDLPYIADIESKDMNHTSATGSKSHRSRAVLRLKDITCCQLHLWLQEQQCHNSFTFRLAGRSNTTNSGAVEEDVVSIITTSCQGRVHRLETRTSDESRLVHVHSEHMGEGNNSCSNTEISKPGTASSRSSDVDTHHTLEEEQLAHQYQTFVIQDQESIWVRTESLAEIGSIFASTIP